MATTDPTLLKNENAQLREDLVFYKNENITYRARIQDLEDEKRALQEKLEKLTRIINDFTKKT